MNFRRILILCGLLAIIVGISIGVARKDHATNHANITVAASFYPLYDFAKQVGGRHVTVSNSTPAGAEPHDYEPSTKDLLKTQKADVFIYNGGTLEPWVTKFLDDYKHTTVKASDHIQLLRTTNEQNQTIRDPHFWLDPVLAEQIVRNIQAGLSTADPTHANDYKRNADAYITALQHLDRAYKTGLASCEQDTIITAHEAFGYLANRYNLNVEAISGVSPDQEPSAATLAEISNLARQKNIHYIFFESLVSPRLADTIAQEVNAQTLVFDPLEGLTHENEQNGKNYLSVQRENLANLRTALACN